MKAMIISYLLVLFSTSSYASPGLEISELESVEDDRIVLFGERELRVKRNTNSHSHQVFQVQEYS